ncbi:alpha/beta fold hydrolase [Micromonospora arida]|uniref:alpha/beta fold hydrolase n=1 Tax=Micromonospora arida TaxID=2203715 RepID=UPI00340BE826
MAGDRPFVAPARRAHTSVAIERAPQILFIQGAGPGVHDEWDNRLVDSLRRELGDGFEVHYPRMPDEADPGYATWGVAIRREIAALDDGAVVVGHSVGGTLLVHTLGERPPQRALGAIVLIAAPFVGAGGWAGDEFELPNDLGARLPYGVPVHVFHGLQDDTAPPSHADLYARVIPQARLHLLPGRDHQLNEDLSEVATVMQRDLATAADGALLRLPLVRPEAGVQRITGSSVDVDRDRSFRDAATGEVPDAGNGGRDHRDEDRQG